MMTKTKKECDANYMLSAPSISFRITPEEKLVLETIAKPGETVHQVARRLLKELLKNK